MNDLFFEPLGQQHDRAAFSCSGPQGQILQSYLRDDGRAWREHCRHVTAVHVMVRKAVPHSICGFFTLSSATIQLEELPAKIAGRLARYRAMPALILGRMAIDDHCRGMDLGTLLIHEAFRCCLALHDSIGFVALIVGAKTKALTQYYERRGFSKLANDDLRLYIMHDTMAQTLEETDKP